MKHNINVIALTTFCFSMNASAQNYVSLGIGTVNVDESSFAIDAGTIETDFDNGTLVSIAFGREFGQVRGELEYSYRENDVDTHRLSSVGDLAGATGEIETTAVMFNAYYDFKPEATFNPYLGLGLGIAEVEADNFGVDAIEDVLDDHDSVFAYQFIAGVSFSALRDLDIFAEFRYMATDQAELTS